MERRTTDTLSSSTPLRIGGTQEINTNYQTLHGKIDNLRIYNYAIGQEVVSQLYEFESNASKGVIFPETEYFFTSAGAVGRLGPTLNQVQANYSGTNLQGLVDIEVQGIQQWTVPADGSYAIEAKGASGGKFNGNAGKGAKLSGRFDLNASQVLNIIVGQEGLVNQNRGGGGGGTFVWIAGRSSPLIVAGGGGGNGWSDVNSMNASLSTAGTGDGGNHYNGGSNGNGGALGYGNSGGGGGWLSAGGGLGGAKIFQGTGIGGNGSGGDGGFGGGGAVAADSSGGGGGYSGGSGGWYGAGGGGSFNSGLNPLSSVRENFGAGSVVITYFGDDLDNSQPQSLSFLGVLQITENKAVGTVLGNIVGTDPDGDQLTYQLTTGVGDGDNSLFLLETNGTLKSAIVFDYETDAHAYGIRVKATDEHGASTEGNFTISLQDEDDTAPLITLNGNSNVIHEAGNIYVDANASWADAVDGNGVLVAAGEVNASKPGSYTLSYNYTDAAGNVAQTVTRTVNVVDTTSPVITLTGVANVMHEAGNFYVDANASWADAVDGNGVLVAAGEVNASKPGSYTLSYNFTDAAGNAAQAVTRTVNVVDTTATVDHLEREFKCYARSRQLLCRCQCELGRCGGRKWSVSCCRGSERKQARQLHLEL